MSLTNFTTWTLVLLDLLSIVSSMLLEKFNFYASQSQYSSEILQTPFALSDVMEPSLDLALKSCQESFKWQRWNCPTSDFYLRHTSKTLFSNPEDVYVTALTTAAIIYTITKNCSTGAVTGCGCSNDAKNNMPQCSDQPNKAAELYRKSTNLKFSKDFHGKVRQHNFMAVTALLQQSLVKKCYCTNMQLGGCNEEICLNVLKPFVDIAKMVREMYDEAFLLNIVAENAQVLWKNVPLDVLVYSKEAPNYCEPDAVPRWNGMLGRQCEKAKKCADHNESDKKEDDSCTTLCTDCGYRVRSRNVVRERYCNCKFMWNFQVQCDLCASLEQQYYCY